MLTVLRALPYLLAVGICRLCQSIWHCSKLWGDHSMVKQLHIVKDIPGVNQVLIRRGERCWRQKTQLLNDTADGPMPPTLIVSRPTICLLSYVILCQLCYLQTKGSVMTRDTNTWQRVGVVWQWDLFPKDVMFITKLHHNNGIHLDGRTASQTQPNTPVNTLMIWHLREF